MNFIDLFSGIGGFRLGMERNGHVCKGFCEIDKFARQTYTANFNTENEQFWEDITTVTDKEIEEFGKRNNIEIICGGFPCQAFSIAGHRRGFEDARGTLFFELARFARSIQPKYLFLENVKGLLNHDKGETFRTILATLDELGYDAEWQVLNSKDFGVPQNRERVFIVGHLRGERTRQIFPLERTGGQNPRELKVLIAGKHQGYSVYDVNGISTTLTSQTGGLGGKTGLSTVCLDKPVGIGSQSKFFIKKQVSTASCLVARDYKGIRKGSTCVLEQFNGIKPRIRKLTPLECFRLQGFPDEFYYKAKQAGVSDSQLYKQAGNSVTVNVIEVIACNFEEVKI